MLVALFVLYVSQYVFYNGAWPTQMRYDFPGLLALPLMAVTLLWLLLRLFDALELPGRSLLHGLAAGTLAMVVLQQGFAASRLAARENAERTIEFTTRLDCTVANLKAEPSRPVLLTSHRPSDYEAVSSLLHYFHAYRVTNPIFLRLEYAPDHPNSRLEKELATGLYRASMNGIAPGPCACGVLPIEQLSRFEPAFAIGLSGEPKDLKRKLGSF